MITSWQAKGDVPNCCGKMPRLRKGKLVSVRLSLRQGEDVPPFVPATWGVIDEHIIGCAAGIP